MHCVGEKICLSKIKCKILFKLFVILSKKWELVSDKCYYYYYKFNMS